MALRKATNMNLDTTDQKTKMMILDVAQEAKEIIRGLQIPIRVEDTILQETIDLTLEAAQEVVSIWLIMKTRDYLPPRI